MNNNIPLQERLLASIAHIPIITLIWFFYITSRKGVYQFFMNNIIALSAPCPATIPIGPILLTLLSIPIGLFIMRQGKNSPIIFENAKGAYLFNIWLLKHYALLLCFSIVGILFSIKLIAQLALIACFGLSIFCFVQSIVGVILASRGHIFLYWYPQKKVL